MSLSTHKYQDGLVLAEGVEINVGESWFSPQMWLPPDLAGVSYEVRVAQTSGTAPTGVFVPRGGNKLRKVTNNVSGVVTTPAVTDDNYLPVIPNILASELPTIAAGTIYTLINLGNYNTNFAELELKITAGAVRLTCIAAAARG